MLFFTHKTLKTDGTDMSAVLKLVALMAVFAGPLDAYRMVLAPKGSCVKKRADVSILTALNCANMGGVLTFYPLETPTAACNMDLCDMSAKGPVANGSMWGIDHDQSDTTTSESRTNGSIRMIRSDCDHIRGRYEGNPTSSNKVNCNLYFIKRDGSDRQNINTLILSGVGECDHKVSYGEFLMIQRECLQIGGVWSGNPGANDMIPCSLDICVSPVIRCTPSDVWLTIQTCRNPSSVSFTCSYRMTTGIKKGLSPSSTSGGSTSLSVTSEVGIQLAEIFTSSVSTNFTTNFQWSSTVSSTDIWSQATTSFSSVLLEAGDAVSIKQVVGMCGDFRVDTPEFKVMSIRLSEWHKRAYLKSTLAKLYRRG